MADVQPRKRRWWLWILAAALAVGLYFAYPILHLADSARRKGFFDKPPVENYEASQGNNLRALYTALMLAHDSDGQFPDTAKWMDAIANRVQTSNMSAEDAAKKFVDPSLAGRPGLYGYAMNDAASGKYKGDLKDPKTILLFTSSDLARNAHGDPKKLVPNPPRSGGSWGITVDGSVVKL
ncbi:MAG: hypothetical protein HYR64_09765 [Fimbriimonas ginsengisoli]|uniref:Uncharacterized protein n=1 Tax=Fimbriimonas ginsengisoli TaxID=1005039 RepID=A0A931PUG5_FIMGI|nr:hypothetical protein [Fimbriimonas ginsengisoli]